MRPGRWHNYYNPAHYYYPTYWRPQTPAPAPVIQTPSFPRQQQTPESGCSGNTACASACLKVSNQYSQCVEWILNEIAKANNKTFTGLKFMLQGFRIYFV